MNISQIDNAIFWHEHVRDNSKDARQRARCNERIERLMRQRMELKRALDDAELTRGAIEHSAWYDTSAELK